MVYDKQTLYVHLFVNTLIFRLRRKMFCFARKKKYYGFLWNKQPLLFLSGYIFFSLQQESGMMYRVYKPQVKGVFSIHFILGSLNVQFNVIIIWLKGTNAL